MSNVYRFTLAGPAKVRVTLKGPEGINLRAMVGRKGNWEAGRLDAALGGGANTFLLDQGDWFVYVRGDKREERPYTLTLAGLDWFGPETDFEPNDTPATANLTPPDLVLKGELSKVDDEDLYRLPDLDQAATLTITPKAAMKNMSYRVYQEVETRTASGPIRREMESAGDFVTADKGETWTIALEPGTKRLLRIVGYEAGAYELALSWSAGPVAAPRPDTTAALTLAATTLKAFDARSQRVAVTLAVSARAAAELPLEFHLTDDRWRIEGAPATLAVAPGTPAEARFTLIAPPDLFAGDTVALSARAGAGAATASVTVTADAVLADPVAEPALPPALLGRLNAAWSSLGATTGEGYNELIDGYATGGTSEDVQPSDDPAYVVTIDLAGDTPLNVTGFIVNPTVGTDTARQVRRFRVETSLDGVTFSEVFQGEAGGRQREYAFVLDQPVAAKFVRYLPMTTLRPDNRAPDTGEFKVIADDGATPLLTGQGFNIADPANGGYIAWWHGENLDLRHVLDAADTAYTASFGRDTPRLLDWVIAFRNQRAARLARIEWQDVANIDPNHLTDAVEIETAMEPNGPWVKQGTWTLDRSAGQPAPFTFQPGTWARFVRFNVVLPPFVEGQPTTYRREPQQIRIIEQPADATGGTILGEWGDLGRQGPYEAAHPAPPPVEVSALEGGDTKADARPLPLDTAKPGRASAGAADHWAIEVPPEAQGLTLTLQGLPALGVTVRLEDAAGTNVPLSVTSENGQTRIHSTAITPGRYTAIVEEPPRSIAVVWDTSGSVGPYVDTIIQSVRSFVRYLTPGRDEVQLMAFDDPVARPLLDGFTGDPLTAFSALNLYSWSDSSSNAEGGALGGAQALENRPGTRAIILITDYQTGGSYNQRNETLEALRRTGARVFAFAIPSDSGADQAGVERSLMELLAAASGGNARYAGTTSDLELAFARTAAALRAPKDYLLTAAVSFRPPEPGTLEVRVPDDITPQAAAPKDRGVLVILDASGSMLKKLGKKRRIDIAKETLTQLTQVMLPEGTPFAMRVFGDTRPDSCETNLRIPLAPLDRPAARTAIDAIKSVNKAKTAIGASLAQAASDLGAGGQKLIILITDGEETCDGDPLAEINRLNETGLDVRVSIVGFAVDDQALKDTFAQWASAGGGGYFDATNSEELAPAVARALLPSFEVVAADGSVVATGVAGGPPLEVTPGTYTIRVLSDPVKEYPGIVVESGGAASVTLGE
ncbi:MAG: VWA domain-containing protein [Micropepsaceae bacterium]